MRLAAGIGAERLRRGRQSKGVADAPCGDDGKIDVARLPGARPATLPAFVAPQLAWPNEDVPEGEDWLHEIKFDGYRTLARIEDGQVRLLTRHGHDWTERYGGLAKTFAPLPCSTALLDGEIVVQDERGVSDFSALQKALAEGRTQLLIFYAFDLVHLDGYDLRAVPLIWRRNALAALLEGVVDARSQLQLSEHVAGNGPAFFAEACRLGLEGVVSKQARSLYRSGRWRSWLKAKCINREEFVIVAYAPSEAVGLASLLLAEPTPAGLRYVGRVGTGFSSRELERLRARLDELRQDAAPVTLPPEDHRRDIVWVQPVLLARVQYAGRTADGLLRHAVYQGLRLDQPAPVVCRRRSRDPGAT